MASHRTQAHPLVFNDTQLYLTLNQNVLISMPHPGVWCVHTMNYKWRVLLTSCIFQRH